MTSERAAQIHDFRPRTEPPLPRSNAIGSSAASSASIVDSTTVSGPPRRSRSRKGQPRTGHASRRHVLHNTYARVPIPAHVRRLGYSSVLTPQRGATWLRLVRWVAPPHRRWNRGTRGAEPPARRDIYFYFSKHYQLFQFSNIKCPKSEDKH